MDFLVRPGSQMPEQSVNVSNVPEAEESKVTKVMLITYFDVRGIVHSEFLLQGQMISQQV